MDIDNSVSPDTFRDKITILQAKLTPILDDFEKYYVFYNKNPEFDEYKNMFDNIKNNLQQISADLFSLSNSVDVNTEEINKKLKNLNILITEERKKNRELKGQLGIVGSEYDGSYEMINNYKEMYNNEYLKNWGLFLGVIFTGVILGTSFRSSQK
jgi:hypothetical protein